MVTTLPPPSPTSLADPPAAGRRSLGYRPAVDGLRAISVIAVLLYHAGLAWIPGGFLGVEVFFVISGFLISTLMIEEWHGSGTLNRPRFWMRRALRLLPALFAVILAVVAYTAIVLPDELARLRGDVIAALTYSTNWFLIFSEQSYFDAFGRESPLKHLWSLAVEEQFYIVWPLVFGFALSRVRGRGGRLLVPLLAGAVASSLLMALLYNPDGDPSRVYYGTDTRAAGLLLGAALACVWTPWRSRRPASPSAGPLLEVAGGVALLALIWYFLNTGEFDPSLYRGGFFIVSSITCVLIAVAVHPSVRLFSGLFSLAPLTWIGLRSYGIYLWHWPVFVFLTADEVGFDGAPLFLVRFAITFVLADLSYRLVEMPIRRQGLAPVKRVLRVGQDGRRGGVAWMTLPVLATVTVLGLLAVDLGSAKKPASPGDDLAASEEVFGPGAEVSLPEGTEAPDAPATSVVNAPATSVPATGAPASEAPATTAPTGVVPTRLAVVGDSVGMTLVRNAPPEAEQAFSIVDASLEGCGIVEGTVVTSARGFRWSFDGCKGWAEKWASQARQAGAQVAVVSIGAWDVFDLKQGESTLAFGSPEHDAHLRSQLQMGIDALKAAGVKVALLGVPCYRPVSAGGLRALPERGDDNRTRHLNELLQAAAAADPDNVRYVAGPQQYCTDPTLAQDLGHRWDGVHYYKPGAQLVWSTIIPELQSIRV